MDQAQGESPPALTENSSSTNLVTEEQKEENASSFHELVGQAIPPETVEKVINEPIELNPSPPEDHSAKPEPLVIFDADFSSPIGEEVSGLIPKPEQAILSPTSEKIESQVQRNHNEPPYIQNSEQRWNLPVSKDEILAMISNAKHSCSLSFGTNENTGLHHTKSKNLPLIIEETKPEISAPDSGFSFGNKPESKIHESKLTQQKSPDENKHGADKLSSPLLQDFKAFYTNLHDALEWDDSPSFEVQYSSSSSSSSDSEDDYTYDDTMISIFSDEVEVEPGTRPFLVTTEIPTQRNNGVVTFDELPINAEISSFTIPESVATESTSQNDVPTNADEQGNNMTIAEVLNQIESENSNFQNDLEDFDLDDGDEYLECLRATRDIDPRLHESIERGFNNDNLEGSLDEDYEVEYEHGSYISSPTAIAEMADEILSGEFGLLDDEIEFPSSILDTESQDTNFSIQAEAQELEILSTPVESLDIGHVIPGKNQETENSNSPEDQNTASISPIVPDTKVSTPAEIPDTPILDQFSDSAAVARRVRWDYFEEMDEKMKLWHAKAPSTTLEVSLDDGFVTYGSMNRIIGQTIPDITEGMGDEELIARPGDDYDEQKTKEPDQKLEDENAEVGQKKLKKSESKKKRKLCRIL